MSKESSELPINKGVELMLRRVDKEVEEPKKGFLFNRFFTLRKKQFRINIEFSWRDLNKRRSE